MKRLLNWTSLLMLAAALIGFVRLGRGTIESAAVKTADVLEFPDFPVNVPRSIEFDTSSPAYADLSRREKVEQQRDWILYAVASSSNLPAGEIEEALRDLPLVRSEALLSSGNGDTGKMRSRLLGKRGDAVIVVPKVERGAQADLLAEAVDEQRKNSGEIPAQVHVFEYEAEPDGEAALVAYRGARPGAEFFEASAGYVETTVQSRKDLETFLGATDDLVSARLVEGKLIVGGRRLNSHRMGRIGVEEIASIYQSSKADPNKLGFSLDPQIDERAVRNSLLLVGVDLRPTAMDDSESVSDGLAGKKRDPIARYHEAFMRTFKGRASDEALAGSFRRLLMRSRFQKARYDGDFQKTEVGMVLFYTDLMMKLWGQDQYGSAPRTIPEFPNELLLNPSSAHEAEVKRIGGTRFWLGLKETGIQKDEQNRQVLMARVATRLFALPHDTLGGHDLEEAEPHVFDRIYIDWWNRHYAEVAEYEPQFERLNDIVKWSVVIGFAHLMGSSEVLAMLDGVSFRKDLWFPDWARRHSELKFREWDRIGFYEPGYNGSSTEAMPILHSRAFSAFGSDSWGFSGGVSLPGVKNLRELPSVAHHAPAAARKGGVTVEESAGGAWRIRTRTGATFETKVASPFSATSRIGIGNKIRLRSSAGELKATAIDRTMTRHGGGSVLRAQVGDLPLGELRLTKTSNGLKTSWSARDADTGYLIARDVSASARPESALLSHPDVAAFVRQNSGAYLVQLRASGKWLRVKPGLKGVEEVPEGSFAKASAGPTSPVVDAAVLPESTIGTELGQLRFVELQPPPTGSSGIGLVQSARPPPEAQVRVVQIADQQVKVFGSSDRTWVDWSSLPRSLQSDPAQLLPAVGRPGVTAPPALGHFRSGDYTNLAGMASENPLAFRARLNSSIDSNLRIGNDLLARRQFEALQMHLEYWRTVYGDLPEMRLQSALSQLDRGQTDVAARTISANGGRPLRRDPGLLNEIESRLADPTLVSRRESYAALADYARGIKETAGKGILTAESEGGVMRLRYEVPELRTARISPDDARIAGARIFVEDRAGLNATDWSPAVTRTRLQDWVQRGKVDIYLMQHTELSSFRPSILTESKRQTRFRLQSNAGVQSGGSGECAQGTESNAGAASGRNAPCDTVILVREKRAS
jgi:hypothetical protein